jgi:RNA polymerase sigma factor (sigma-70 family)
MDRRDWPDPHLVSAAQQGRQSAVDALIAGALPLVYNVVGRALPTASDVDDVVQETMLRCLENLNQLRDPARFRSWLVAIAIHEVRDRYRARQAHRQQPWVDEVNDPGADFADLTILRLELTSQRREIARATRWIDPENRELLALWWLEAAGTLTRDEVASAAGLTRDHAAVRIQRMKAQLGAARAVVRALDANPPCADLMLLATGWSGEPDPLWRKRFARHTRECVQCGPVHDNLVAAERLLAGLALVPLPPALNGLATWLGSGAATAGQAVAATQAAAGHAVATQAVASAPGLLGRITEAVGTKLLVGATVATVGAAAVTVYVAAPDRDEPPAAAVFATPTVAAPTTSNTPTPPTPPGPHTSPKKGVSTWAWPGNSDAMKEVGATWFYNWSASGDQTPAPNGVEFVPMIWGANAANDSVLGTARRNGDVLLAFNEPDLAGQANMTVEQALDLWPRLQATGMRLGSPAPAFGGADAGGWLDRFMIGARDRGYRVDFITVHWYGSDFSAAAVGHLRSYLQAVHDRYGLPIWLTEYALIGFAGGGRTYPTDEQQAAFVTGSTDMLESLSYVERYAWFALPATDDSPTGLYRDGSTPTAAGQAYRLAGD